MASVTRRAADVRINEVDLSTTIMTNSNATAAQVVVSKQGPIEPIFCSNFEDYMQAFGAPDASVSFDHYGAQDYFKEGNSFWAVRAVGDGALWGGVIVYNNDTDVYGGGVATDTFVASLTTGTATPDDPDFATIAPANSVPLFQVTPRNGPGSYSDNIAVSVESPLLRPPVATSLTYTQLSQGLLVPGLYQYMVTAVGKYGETLPSQEMSVNIPEDSDFNTNILTWEAVPGAIKYRIYRRTSVYGPTTQLGWLEDVGGFTTKFYDPGLDADSSIQPPTQSDPTNIGNGTFTLNIYDLTISATRPIERWNCSLTDQVDETGTQMEIEQRVNSFSRYVRVQSNSAMWIAEVPPVYSSISHLQDPTPAPMAGGTSGVAPTAVDINTALNIFANKELYTIDVFIACGRTAPEIVRNGDALAVQRNDAVYFADTPPGAQRYQDAITYRNTTLNLNSSYTALFCSDLLELDPISAKQLYVPPSGAMAGLYARTSRIAQPWFSIAGLNRGLLNILGVRETYDDGQATLLYQSQVNYMRKFIGRGIALWEQTTLYNANSALQFLNVRFLLNVIKRSLYGYLLYGLQEQNDDILHKQLKFTLEQYLQVVKDARGLAMFRVVISSNNNPPALVNSGILAIAVVLQPILAVREIQLTLVVTKEGLEIDEQTIASL